MTLSSQADNNTLLQDKIAPAMEVFLKERGLSLSEEKTRITHIEQGFDFLGQNVRKYKNKLLIKPSKKNVTAIKEKIRTVIVKNQTSTQAVLIRQLNPIIRGWASYQRHVVAKETFVKLDDYIFKLLWYWARRRHSRKSAIWVKKKYFPHFKGTEWTFACIDDKELVRLYRAQIIPIKRHVKIRGNANPCSIDWFEYFEKRKNPIRL